MVRTLKRLAKRAVAHVVARIAPMTWRWRKPGSLIVLMYHRVLPKDSPARQNEQPGMYISPETLDLHLSELKRHFELVHLDDWLRRAKDGTALPKLACALTFDDGWRDNYEFALPVLAKHQAPATIFLVSSYIGSTQRFWPNRLMELVRAEVTSPGSVWFPPKLRALVAPALAQAGERGLIDADALDPIVQRALQLNEGEIRALVRAAKGDCQTAVSIRETLDQREIDELATSGLIHFGSHTRTHLRLHESASNDAQLGEIVQSRVELQAICGQSIDVFCYPNGVTCGDAVSLVSRHYRGAVSTSRGWHVVGSSPYLIPRIAVHDDISSDRIGFLACLSAWL